MASASPADLIRLLLRQSDRHPIGTLDGLDLADHDRSFVDRLIERRVLVERAPLESAGELQVQLRDGRALAFCPGGRELMAEIDPRSLRQFEIGMLDLCSVIRRANGFVGPPVERLSHRVFHLGDRGVGRRRRPVFLARLLRQDNALETVLAVRSRAAGREVALLTPTASALTLDTTRRIESEGVALVAVSEALRPAHGNPFALVLPVGPAVRPEERAAARLSMDVTGHAVVFDGADVALAPREFNLLVVLANEAAADGGFVDRDTLYKTIESAASAAVGEVVYDEQIAKSVSLLRKALAEAAGLCDRDRRRLIENKRKVGYRLALRPAEVAVS